MLFALISFSWKQIFGVSGQNIDQIRNYTGATVTVLAQNQLPLCASAHESDRVVQPNLDMHLPFHYLLILNYYASSIVYLVSTRFSFFTNTYSYTNIMSYPVLGAKKAYTTSNAYAIIFIFDVYDALTCEQRASMRSNSCGTSRGSLFCCTTLFD